MAMSNSAKRKRSRNDLDEQDRPEGGPSHRAKRAREGRTQRADSVSHGVLAQYYPGIQTLRDYVLSKLPSSSRLRRKKIAAVGRTADLSEGPPAESRLALGRLLDTTIVAFHGSGHPQKPDNRWDKWMEYSQRGDESYVTLSDGLGSAASALSEVVDFVVWLLFSREPTGSWPKHLLCDGFRKTTKTLAAAQPPGLCIPGLFVVHPNRRVEALKQSPWPELLRLLGRSGEQVIMDLLLDCTIFTAVKVGKGNLYQLSGQPISELQVLTPTPGNASRPAGGLAQKPNELSPAEIIFVKSRMMYSRPALNARGSVHFGLRHIHVLNRFHLHRPTGGGGRPEDVNDQTRHAAPHTGDDSTIHVMMYIFPRQFGLHNVFTSVVDRQLTAQKFQDYTLREEGIARRFVDSCQGSGSFKVHLPKRLRGLARDLTRKLQVLHQRCSYTEMLQHYCPAQEQIEAARRQRQAAGKSLQSRHAKGRKKARLSLGAVPSLQYASLVELATPIANISAFCQAVLARIIPDDFWGDGRIQEENKKVFLKKVDHFVHLRRFETMSLHEAAQGIKITSLEWLTPPSLKNQKCSQTETRKRAEIFNEFLYYLFDSLLIPLIRSNFYVTESNVHRYRVFYFRHDVWRFIAEPAMASLKTKMFEEVKLEDALRILDSRRLGFSQVRLLPKETTMRPITNLRRRTVLKGARKLLGPSINTLLEPVSSALKLEKILFPDRLGAALFSVGDIYHRIKVFKTMLGSSPKALFFAKVDVQAAFDTIPQEAVIELMATIPTHSRYELAKHVEVQLAENTYGKLAGTKTTKRWHSIAKAAGDSTPFPEVIEERLGAKRKGTVFVDGVVRKPYETNSLLRLMTNHVRQNLVKLGKKYYRQKHGIPQGSVLSSTICNYFYADLELRHLSFLHTEDCLLLRLIDDFLLITTSKEKAERFMSLMHRGFPEYGVAISAGKSLLNFEMDIGGVAVPRFRDSRQFPYCGTLIDCITLDVSKDRAKSKDLVIFNTLTVEFFRYPGQNFKRKVLNAFKIQSHLMFYDTSHNSDQTVLRNIYTAFVETATKTWAYARCLPTAMRRSNGLIIESIEEVIEVAFRLLSSKSRQLRYPGYQFSIKKTHLAWLAMVAFRQLFTRKQATYQPAVLWLEDEIRKLSARKGFGTQALLELTKKVSLFRL